MFYSHDAPGNQLSLLNDIIEDQSLHMAYHEQEDALQQQVLAAPEEQDVGLLRSCSARSNLHKIRLLPFREMVHWNCWKQRSVSNTRTHPWTSKPIQLLTLYLSYQT